MAILILAIFAPGVTAIIITRYLDYKVRKRPSWIQTFSFDHRSLFKQPWFWLTSISGLLYTLVFMGIAVFDRKVLLTSEGFKNFINDAQLSLGILSAFSLLTLLISRIHASYQSEKQITELEQKNNLDLYFTLKDRYISEISAIYNKNYRSITWPIYKTVTFNTIGFGILFKGSPSTGKPLLNNKNINRICINLRNIQECLAILTAPSHREEEYLDKFLSVNKSIMMAMRRLGIEGEEVIKQRDWGMALREETKDWLSDNDIKDHGIDVVNYHDIKEIIEIYNFLLKCLNDVLYDLEMTYGEKIHNEFEGILDSLIYFKPEDNEVLEKIKEKYFDF